MLKDTINKDIDFNEAYANAARLESIWILNFKTLSSGCKERDLERLNPKRSVRSNVC